MVNLRVVTSIDFRHCRTEAQIASFLAVVSLLYQATQGSLIKNLERQPIPTMGKVFQNCTGRNDDLQKAFQKASFIRVESQSLPGCLGLVRMDVKFRRDCEHFWEENFHIHPDGTILGVGSCGRPHDLNDPE
jgi:hypothetical protein